MKKQNVYGTIRDTAPIFLKMLLNVRDDLVDSTEVILINQDGNSFHKGISLGLSECHLDTGQDQSSTWFTLTLADFEHRLAKKVAGRYDTLERLSEVNNYYIEYGVEGHKVFTVYVKEGYVKSVYMYLKAENDLEYSINNDFIGYMIEIFSPWFENTVSSELCIYEENDSAPPNRVVVCGNVIYYYAVSKAPLYPGFTIAAAYKSEEGEIVIGPM